MRFENNKLILGSAQWGLEYGVKNKWSQTCPKRVSGILDHARDRGVKYIDTARCYGDSEVRIGEDSRGCFNVITKLMPLERDIDTVDKVIGHLEASFNKSCKALKSSTLYGVLVHHSNDFEATNGKSIGDYLNRLKDAGSVIKIGVSVYSNEQLESALKTFKPDIVQLPLNVFDRRMVQSGAIERLHDCGIEVHARSAFLQGLLLMSPQEYPRYFDRWKRELQSWVDYCASKEISQLCGALSYVLNETFVDKIVVGVDSASELEDILSTEYVSEDFLEMDREYSSELIDPFRWSF